MNEKENAFRKALEAVKVYVFRNGRPIAVAADPEQVNVVRDAVRAFNEEDTNYGVSAQPFSYTPGGATYFELGGFPKFLWETAAEVAHEQSLAKGFRGVRWLS